MSEIESPVEGAAILPDVPAEPAKQEPTQEPATATPEATDEAAQARDENGRFQKRLNELTRKQHDARREAEAARRERDEARAELERLRQPPAPDPEYDLPGYVRHLASQEARELVEGERKQWQQQQQSQYLNNLAQQYATREEAYIKDHPDYAEAVEAFTAIVGSNVPLAEVLMTSDHGPAVAHYLGMNLDEAERIAMLPPHLAAAAVARIEARVSAPKPKPATQTPPPPPTLGGSSVAPKEPAKMSYTEYRAWRSGK